MISSIYIAASLFYFLFAALPEYRLEKDAAPYRDEAMYRRFGDGYMRRLRWFGKWAFRATCANLAVCGVLLVLKCMGILAWW